MCRNPIEPNLTASFDEIYTALRVQPNRSSPELLTTGNTPFIAIASITNDGRRFINLPHNNRIYQDDWGFMNNSMGHEGQRIGQYSVPLDEWLARF
jgi:hypothetical protein